MSVLPDRDRALAVIGGTMLSSAGMEMAALIGGEIVASGSVLLTGGRCGAGEQASLGAARQCRKLGIPIDQRVFAVVPFGIEPDFRDECAVVHAGKDRFERSMVLMNRARVAFVIGGGRGTKNEVMHAAVEYYMAWGSADVLPVAGTGGVADEIIQKVHGYKEDDLNDPAPSLHKARLLMKCAESGTRWLRLDEVWGIDVHGAFPRDDDPDPVVRRFSRIRHYPYGRIRIEGEDGAQQSAAPEAPNG